MIKKFIRGHATRGSEVIKELEKLGGVDVCKVTGGEEDNIYYIDDKLNINYDNANSILGILIQENFDEILLPRIFVQKEYVIVTEKKEKMDSCEGCLFDNCRCLDLPIFSSNCNGVIYKLKQ